MKNFDALEKFLETPRKIVITTHIRPDADALGSSLAVYQFLVKHHHTVHVVTPTDYPDFLKWMPFENNVTIYTEQKKESESLISAAELIICLDFSGKTRIGEMESIIFDNTIPKLLIDHHLEADRFAEYELWVDSASSTCELVYDFIKYFDKNGIDVPTAECIYAGMVTDTGSFRFPSTSKKVHLIIADLLDLGLNHAKIHQLIYDTNSASRLRLLGHAISKKMTVLPNYHTAFIALSKDDLNQFNAQNGDTEGIVNYALSLKGIVFAALIKEADDFVKMSFRSKGDFAANLFAKEYFEGGGHKNAAGGKSALSFEDTVAKFRAVLPHFSEKLNETKENDHV